MHAFLLFVLLSTALATSPTHAEVYKFVDENGVVRFTNYIPEGVKSVEKVNLDKAFPISPELPVPKNTIAPKLTTSEKSIPLRYRGGVYELRATINDEVTAFFVVDSGAATVSIGGSAARILIDNGSITGKNLLGSSKYKLADGSTRAILKVRLDSIVIGDLILKNIEANIIEDPDAPSLLGQSALKHMIKWNIDTQKHLFTYTAP